MLVTNRSSPTSCTLRAERLGDRAPAVPVAFGDAVLDRDDRILPDPVLVERDHLVGRAGLLAGLLELVRLASTRSRTRSTRRRARGTRCRPPCSRPARPLRAPGRPPRGSTTGSARSRPRRRPRWHAPSSSGCRAGCGRSRRRRAALRRTTAAPTGITMNSWKSTLLSACAPPLRMFIIGTGSTVPPSAPPCRLARCW